jgi:hypothetical protein
MTEGEDAFPIVLHANDRPGILLRLVVERLRERADFRVGLCSYCAIVCRIYDEVRRGSRAGGPGSSF